jgi:hypothetical protein
MAVIEGRFFHDCLLKKSNRATIGEQRLPEFIDQRQNNKYSGNDIEEIFFLEIPGADDDFVAMIADRHLCVDGLVTVGATNDMLHFTFSLGDPLFNFPVNVIGPFAINGGTFSSERHAVCPDETLQAIRAGNFLHHRSPFALSAKGHSPSVGL